MPMHLILVMKFTVLCQAKWKRNLMEKWFIGKAPFFSLELFDYCETYGMNNLQKKEDQSDLENLIAYGSDCTEMGGHVKGLV